MIVWTQQWLESQYRGNPHALPIHTPNMFSFPGEVESRRLLKIFDVCMCVCAKWKGKWNINNSPWADMCVFPPSSHIQSPLLHLPASTSYQLPHSPPLPSSLLQLPASTSYQLPHSPPLPSTSPTHAPPKTPQHIPHKLSLGRGSHFCNCRIHETQVMWLSCDSHVTVMW